MRKINFFEKPQNFKIRDLEGRIIKIEKIKNEDIVLIVGLDVNTNDVFILEEYVERGKE